MSNYFIRLCYMPKSQQKRTELIEDDRPGEKLLKKGASFLSDSEILGILLLKGTKEKTTVDLARELLTKYNNLPNLSSRHISELSSFKGIGPTKAAIIAAAFELGKRVHAHRKSPETKFKSSKQIARHYIPLMRDLKKEVFKVALLNGANRFIKDITISEGILNASLVHPREVFREVILEPATGIILIHNHPCGNLEPSKEDIRITKRLVEAGRLFGIKVLDHVIICGDRYKSFADEGMM